jgi:hypothetical protein
MLGSLKGRAKVTSVTVVRVIVAATRRQGLTHRVVYPSTCSLAQYRIWRSLPAMRLAWPVGLSALAAGSLFAIERACLAII